MNAIHNRARAVIIIDDHILVCKHHHTDQPPLYTLPGGHIEHGEIAAQAVVREVKEETGLECSVQRFLGCLEQIYFKKNERIQEYCFFFAVTLHESTQLVPITQQEPLVSLEWIPLKDLSYLAVQPTDLPTILQSWLNNNPTNCLVTIQ